MDLVTGGIVLSSLLVFGAVRKYQTTAQSQEKSLVTGPFITLQPIVLTHAHPDGIHHAFFLSICLSQFSKLGWGSGAVMQHIRQGPNALAVEQIVRDLQTQGVAIVDNLYEDLCVEKLGYAGCLHSFFPLVCSPD
jgi:hypothetical protein